MAYTNDSTLDLSSRERARHIDDLLDEAVADSFPASDPVSLAMPHRRVEAGPAVGLSTLLIVGAGLLALAAVLALRR
jgi:hypothetical protein